MKTFTQWMKEHEIVGIYPPEYGGIGTHPPLANQTGTDRAYVKASRHSKLAKKKKKHHIDESVIQKQKIIVSIANVCNTKQEFYETVYSKFQHVMNK